MTLKGKKKKYTKRDTAYWEKLSGKPAAQIAIAPKADNEELLSFIFNGIDRLSTSDKARIFAYVLGKDELNEHQLWSVQKVLS